MTPSRSLVQIASVSLMCKTLGSIGLHKRSTGWSTSNLFPVLQLRAGRPGGWPLFSSPTNVHVVHMWSTRRSIACFFLCYSNELKTLPSFYSDLLPRICILCVARRHQEVVVGSGCSFTDRDLWFLKQRLGACGRELLILNCGAQLLS